MNPTFDKREIERAYREDPIAAAAEYGAEFRTDVESFISRDAIMACVPIGERELPPMRGTRYRAFLDFAGGSGTDSATLAIAHDERDEHGVTIAVLDVIRERKPPFSPEDVCIEFAQTCKAYNLREATSDRWGGDFPIERMKAHGVKVTPSARPKSDIYRDLLPLLNSQRVELLDNNKLIEQLAGLERRVARGGRDSIDHAPGGHDDLINSAAGVLVTTVVSPKGGALAGKLSW